MLSSVPTRHWLTGELLKKDQAPFRTKKDGSNSKRCLLWSFTVHAFLAVPYVHQTVTGTLRSGWSPAQGQCLPQPCGRRKARGHGQERGRGAVSSLVHACDSGTASRGHTCSLVREDRGLDGSRGELHR